MYLVAIAWMYVVLMMAVVEATSKQGTVLGALLTFLMYGVGPLALVLYLLGTPGRRQRLRAAEEASAAQAQPSTLDPDGRREAAGDTLTPVRKEP